MDIEIFDIASAYGSWIIADKESDINAFIKLFKSRNSRSGIINISLKKSSNSKKKLYLENNDNSVIIISDDLKINEWEANAQKLVNRLFLPIFHSHIPCILHLKSLSLDYLINLDTDFNPIDLHNNKEKISNQLALEQISQLIGIRELRFTGTNDRFQSDTWIPGWIQDKITTLPVNSRNISWDKKRKLLYLSETKVYFLPDWQWSEKSNHVNYFSINSDFRTRGSNAQTYVSSLKKQVLDEHQQLAASPADGPVLVSAPAGSGKTRTLIQKIMNLVMDRNIPEERILALAFNRKAMIEMKERLALLGLTRVKIYTLHAFGYMVLKKYFPSWRFDTDLSNQVNIWLYKALKENYNLNIRIDDDLMDELVAAYFNVKSVLTSPEEIFLEYEGITIHFNSIFKTFLKMQQKRKIIFFEDMIYFTIRYLLKNKQIRSPLQYAFSHILVDEFQDLNPAQIWMIKLLSSPTNNVTCFGDDDQLIYEWRGAQVETMLYFHETFGQGHHFNLNYNYRTPLNLLGFSRNLINHNRKRIKKEIEAGNKNRNGEIQVLPAKDISHELSILKTQLNKWLSDGIPHSGITILTRYNIFVFLLAMDLVKSGFPVKIDDISVINDSRVMTDLMNYLQIVVNPLKSSPKTIEGILKRPNKYLPHKWIKTIENYEELFSADLSEFSEWQKIKIEDFRANLRYIHHLVKFGEKPRKILKEIYDRFDFDKYYQDISTNSWLQLEQVSGRSVWELFEDISQQYSTIEELYSSILDMVGNKQNFQTGITVTTIHKTKGNEFNNVFVFHGNVLNHDGVSDSISEGERRVFYVAMTRAKQRLCLSFVNDGQPHFIHEIFVNNYRPPETAKQFGRFLLKILNEHTDDSLIKSELIKTIKRQKTHFTWKQWSEHIEGIWCGLIENELNIKENADLFQFLYELKVFTDMKKNCEKNI